MIPVSIKTGAFLIIYAVNIHTGGGKVLLDELIENQPLGKITAAFLDERYQLQTKNKFPVFISRGKLIGRAMAEMQLHNYIKEFNIQDPILFFGNIPPFFKPNNQSYLYLQNCFLTRQVPLPRDSYKEMIRNWVESILLRLLQSNVSEIWVQTSWMKRVTEKYLPSANVKVVAFLPQFKLKLDPAIQRKYDFLYVGSLALNKRFSFFKETLSLLNSKLTKQIKVAIVLDQETQSIENLSYENIEISLHFRISRDDISKLYQQSKIFVTTSLNESFCLPLYESNYFGCKVIAPNSGYTEDLPFAIQHFQKDSMLDLRDKMLNSF